MGFMTMGLENGLTILLAIIAFVIVLMAQVSVNGAFNKYKKVSTKKGLTGFETARQILDRNGLNNIHIVEVRGNLTDHYDPRRKVVRLSHEIFHGNSVASISIAAHEVGHALQDKNNYIFLKIRAFLVPVVNLISYLGYFSLFISILGGLTSYLMMSILIISATIVFQLITLPVEFDASKRAKVELVNLGIIDKPETKGVEKMLTAAALTYVAGLVSSILNLLRLIIMTRDSD